MLTLRLMTRQARLSPYTTEQSSITTKSWHYRYMMSTIFIIVTHSILYLYGIAAICTLITTFRLVSQLGCVRVVEDLVVHWMSAQSLSLPCLSPRNLIAFMFQFHFIVGRVLMASCSIWMFLYRFFPHLIAPICAYIAIIVWLTTL